MSIFQTAFTLLPFGAYTAINPISAAGTTFVYSATVDSLITLLQWTQSFIVPGGINNAGNNWDIQLGYDTIPNVATLLYTINSNGAGAQWGQGVTKTFVLNVLDPTITRNMWVRVTKIGAPSAIFVACPALRVKLS